MKYVDQHLELEAAFRDLTHPDVRVRLAAADALSGATGDHAARARQALRPLLGDDSAEVRYTVALSLGELRDQEAIEALLEQIDGDGHPMPRQAAVIALGLIGDSRAVPRLIELLRRGPPDARFQAATSLAQIDPQAAFKPLCRALKDRDPEVRTSAAAALGVVQDQRACAALTALLEDPVQPVRFEAAVSLARLDDRRSAAVLVDYLLDQERRHLAAEHLYHCPDEAVLPTMRDRMRRWMTPPLVKVWLAAALVRLGCDEGRPVLLKTLASRRMTVRGLTIQVLGEIGDAWAKQALQELATSPAGQRWREEIQEALATIASREPPK